MVHAGFQTETQDSYPKYRNVGVVITVVVVAPVVPYVCRTPYGSTYWVGGVPN